MMIWMIGFETSPWKIQRNDFILDEFDNMWYNNSENIRRLEHDIEFEQDVDEGD